MRLVLEPRPLRHTSQFQQSSTLQSSLQTLPIQRQTRLASLQDLLSSSARSWDGFLDPHLTLFWLSPEGCGLRSAINGFLPLRSSNGLVLPYTHLALTPDGFGVASVWK